MNSTELKNIEYPQCANSCDDIRSKGCTVCDKLCSDKMLPVNIKNNKILKVRIISSEMSTFWYANLVGQIYEVKPALNGFITIMKIKDNTYGFIKKEDCVII
jgi:hypothetical protein